MVGFKSKTRGRHGGTRGIRLALKGMGGFVVRRRGGHVDPPRRRVAAAPRGARDPPRGREIDVISLLISSEIVGTFFDDAGRASLYPCKTTAPRGVAATRLRRLRR